MDPLAFEGRKRAYCADSSIDNCQNTTLIGNYWAEAGSHNDNISTQHHQQKRRLFGQVPPAPPLVSVWDHRIQNSPESYRGLVTSSSGRLNRASASSSGPPRLNCSFQSLHEAPIFPLQSQNSSMPFVPMMFDGGRHQPRADTEYPTDSGSNDSRTLRGSCDISHAASQSGALELMFDIPDDLSYTFVSEAAGDYPPTEGLGLPAGHDMTNYPGTLLTHGQDVHYPGVWQHQDDLPWSPVDASHSHTTVLTQRLRTSPWPEDLVEGHAGGLPVQHLNPSSVYPSQISSPLSNASWHPSEMVLLTSTMQLPDPFLNHAQESFQGEDLMFREHQDLSGTLVQNGPERENCQFLPLIYNMQNPSPSDSWNSVDVSRSIHFMPEEFTLTDWPTLLNEQLSNNVSETTSNFPPTSPVPQGVDGLFRPMSKGVVPTTLKDRKWEHTIVSDGSIQQLGNQTTFKCSKKKGRRIGALSEDTARKAREVRHNRACWRCWHLHLSCSVDRICDKCQNPSSFRVCNKAHLYDYTELFFPELVVARRHPSAVQQLINENIAGFTPNKIQVHLSSGPAYQPIILTVYEFVTKNDDFLFLYWAPPELNSPMPNLERIYTPPLGLFENKDDNKLKDSCQDHIKSLIRNSQFSKDATSGDASPVAWEVYEAVNRYRKSRRMLGNDELIRKVTKLLAIHFVMSRVIGFTQDSAKKVVQNLRSPMQLPYKHNVSSKLLNHQIKRELNMLQHELTSDILEKLQTELRRRSKASWATSFCVILVLSMCMEAIQIALDGFTVQKMLENDGTSNLPLTRDDGFGIARRLDNLPFKDCMDIFHMIYRSGESQTGPNKGGFNPIRDGIEIDKAQGIDEDTVQLVNEIRGVMNVYQEEIEEKAKNPIWDCRGDVLADHYRFRRENSGRLVAKFLKSFQDAS